MEGRGRQGNEIGLIGGQPQDETGLTPETSLALRTTHVLMPVTRRTRDPLVLKGGK